MQKLNDELFFREIEDHRNESCSHYRECLDEASRKAWPSFSCVACRKYDPKTIIIELSRDYPTEPYVPDNLKAREFSALLSSKMRKMNVPIKGTGIGNQDWRDKTEANK